MVVAEACDTSPSSAYADATSPQGEASRARGSMEPSIPTGCTQNSHHANRGCLIKSQPLCKMHSSNSRAVHFAPPAGGLLNAQGAQGRPLHTSPAKFLCIFLSCRYFETTRAHSFCDVLLLQGSKRSTTARICSKPGRPCKPTGFVYSQSGVSRYFLCFTTGFQGIRRSRISWDGVLP